ncbi:thiamine pyrophosphate-dependent dehydrogenase E1 component subunit alpha [Pseudogracilibacillus auburnensis]|uniref:2-oxoisovalerate dehydrogenase subunit alpha n=1 Tax=Pseudogracilibacillus auburnensis TaxID=1494959 RepID=A0A2V3VT61_9BACI|nr:thiamine pyrophosphate-dependent dehydrogenase E1 component subunit alpha [Pseudogracilibacillus auburnensis]MBO1004320.1 thiamine pyrophosphate-dependent dehydrogenase E1 component subunit alpha [Pseudogracilibacillus auburnensis]PXW85072.1 branched-chain alpha-keto acid dehydrogenase E1 component [Pseudogracilibacillus auburnensis]
MGENKHSSLGLRDKDVVEMYKTMILARKIDERMWLLNRAGKIPFVISCQGQEAAQVGTAFALDRDVDYIAPYYRDMGIVLAFGMTTKDLMLSGFAKAEDPNSGGRQMPGHFGQKKNRIITGSSPVTTQVPHAVGFALAAKLKQQNFVTLTTLGDGSTNQGDFHEGLNFAGVHKLPVITVVQNNQLAISVPFEKQIASENIAVRAKSYGMPGILVDGNNPLEVYRAVKEARERAINGEGPTLIEALTVRLTAHSSDDNDRSYRTKEQLEEAKKNDCIGSFSAYLQDIGLLTPSLEKEINDEINAEVNEATDYAEQAAFAPNSTLLDYVYEK